MSHTWYQGMSLYQIYPRSFADSNNDGVGDLAGITAKLDYIKDLGFDAIWISPFFTSPMKDFGYDVADYEGVDPLFGTLADFDALAAKAQKLGLKILLDVVWGHTSDQHAWFKASSQSRDNAYADYYIWANAKPDGTAPNNWLSIFGGQAWTWHAKRGQYYMHNFLKEQPQINFRNPKVFDGLMAAADFWVKRGVHGFRVDAVPHYLCDPQLRDNPARTGEITGDAQTALANPRAWQDNIYCQNLDETFDLVARIRQHFDKAHPGQDIMLLGEILSGDDTVALGAQYTQGHTHFHTVYTGELLMNFNVTANFVRDVVRKVSTHYTPTGMTWALASHDVPRLFSRMAGSCPSNPRGFWELMVALYSSLNGQLCWYQGDELGLPEAELELDEIQDPYGKAFWPEFKGRDGCRTPMPWVGAAGGGFSGDANVKPWLPLKANHLALNVAGQVADASSMLNFLKARLAARKANPSLLYGDCVLLEITNPQLVAFTRSYQGQTTLCAFNFDVASNAEINGHVLQPLGWVVV